MNVLNIHTRIIDKPHNEVSKLMYGLATKDDQIWPKDKWPAMRFKYGLAEGNEGGHGIIRYRIESYDPKEQIKFKFLSPVGFDGYHQLEFKPMSLNKTKISHSIKMRTSGLATFKWIFVIKSLHDALIEDAFDNIENLYSTKKKKSSWSLWVRLWRLLLR